MYNLNACNEIPSSYLIQRTTLTVIKKCNEISHVETFVHISILWLK